MPPNDPDEAARCLENFIADKEELKAAGQAARKLAEERFSRDILAEQLQKVLVDAVNGQKGE